MHVKNNAACVFTQAALGDGVVGGWWYPRRREVE